MKTESNRSLWPWGIIAVMAVFIVGLVVMIAFAVRSNSDLVSKDYYEDELRYQTQLDSARRTQQLDQRAVVAYDESRKSIRIAVPTDHARQNPVGTVTLYRPSSAALDRNLKLELSADGSQQIDAADLAPGPWKIRVLWTVGTQEFYVDQPIVIKAAKS